MELDRDEGLAIVEGLANSTVSQLLETGDCGTYWADDDMISVRQTYTCEMYSCAAGETASLSSNRLTPSPGNMALYRLQTAGCCVVLERERGL